MIFVGKLGGVSLDDSRNWNFSHCPAPFDRRGKCLINGLICTKTFEGAHREGEGAGLALGLTRNHRADLKPAIGT